jgi:hypothetical protein
MNFEEKIKQTIDNNENYESTYEFHMDCDFQLNFFKSISFDLHKQFDCDSMKVYWNKSFIA